MLRLNVYCSLIPCPRQIKLGCGCRSWIIRHQGAKKPFGRVSIRALKDETDGGGASSSPGQSWEPGLEIEVPFEQRPVNEYSSLKDGPLYSWGELGPREFFLRLGGLWLVTFTVIGVPVAAASFNPSKEPLRFMLAAGTGTLLLVSLTILRIYLGWSYVGDRLLSAVIPYEESGWYDGQMWVKPPEVLARDRLLGSYKVKPVVQLLKQTLVGTGALLVTGALLFVFATPVQDFLQTTFAKSKNPPNGVASEINKKYNVRKDELLALPVEVISDDDLAAAAATAAEGRPVYKTIFHIKHPLEYCRSYPCMVRKQRDTSRTSTSDVSRDLLFNIHIIKNHSQIDKSDLKYEDTLADEPKQLALRSSLQKLAVACLSIK